MEYLILLVSILLVCIIINVRYNLQIFETLNQAVVVIISLFIIGVVLDSIAVFRGYWSYNQKENFFVGIKIGLLPIEEYLFMIVIPFLTLTINSLVRKKNRKK